MSTSYHEPHGTRCDLPETHDRDRDRWFRPLQSLLQVRYKNSIHHDVTGSFHRSGNALRLDLVEFSSPATTRCVHAHTQLQHRGPCHTQVQWAHTSAHVLHQDRSLQPDEQGLVGVEHAGSGPPAASVSHVKVGSLEWLTLSAKLKWAVACRTVREVRCISPCVHCQLWSQKQACLRRWPTMHHAWRALLLCAAAPAIEGA